jgi:hypothetical protein
MGRDRGRESSGNRNQESRSNRANNAAEASKLMRSTAACDPNPRRPSTSNPAGLTDARRVPPYSTKSSIPAGRIASSRQARCAQRFCRVGVPGREAVRIIASASRTPVLHRQQRTNGEMGAARICSFVKRGWCCSRSTPEAYALGWASSRTTPEWLRAVKAPHDPSGKVDQLHPSENEITSRRST